MQEEFNIGDTVYYIGPDDEYLPRYGQELRVDRVYDNTITASCSSHIFEVNKKFISKTHTAKQKPSADIVAENIRKAFAGGRTAVDKNTLQSFVESISIGPRNPTALILRQIADQIESGDAQINRFEYASSIHVGTRTTIIGATIREENAQ